MGSDTFARMRAFFCTAVINIESNKSKFTFRHDRSTGPFPVPVSPLIVEAA